MGQIVVAERPHLFVADALGLPVFGMQRDGVVQVPAQCLHKLPVAKQRHPFGIAVLQFEQQPAYPGQQRDEALGTVAIDIVRIGLLPISLDPGPALGGIAVLAACRRQIGELLDWPDQQRHAGKACAAGLGTLAGTQKRGAEDQIRAKRQVCRQVVDLLLTPRSQRDGIRLARHQAGIGGAFAMAEQVQSQHEETPYTSWG